MSTCISSVFIWFPLHINHTPHTFININCLLEINIFFQSIFKVPFRNCLSKGLSLRSEFKQLLAYLTEILRWLVALTLSAISRTPGRPSQSSVLPAVCTLVVPMLPRLRRWSRDPYHQWRCPRGSRDILCPLPSGL